MKIAMDIVKLARYSLSYITAIFLFTALVITFPIYVDAEKKIDRVNELRYQSLLLIEELARIDTDLTVLARSFVTTGNPIYKQQYQEIIDIIAGKKPRTLAYLEHHLYISAAITTITPSAIPDTTMPLLSFFRYTGFNDQEIRTLTAAKKYSDDLTVTEYRAMALKEASLATPLNENAIYASALALLYDERYSQAKLTILDSINTAYEHMNMRTAKAVQNAKKLALFIRVILIVFGISLILMLWQMRQSLRLILGGTVEEVYLRIKHLGDNQFSPKCSYKKAPKNSVLEWLQHSQQVLYELHQSKLKAEIEMHRMDVYFRNTFKRIPDPLTLQSAKGIIIDCSDAFCDISGYSKEEILGKTTQQLNLWADTERRAEFWRLLEQNGFIDEFEFQLRRRNGELRTILLSSRNITNEFDPLFLTIAHDVTELERAKKELITSTEWQKTITEYAGHAIVTTDANGFIKTFNPASEQLWGYKAEELIDKCTPLIFHYEPELKVRAALFSEELGETVEPGLGLFLIKALRGLPNEHEWTLIRKDGSHFPALLCVTLLRDAAGNVTGSLGLAQDITERKRVEMELQNNSERTQAILDNMLDGVITINLRGIISSFNKAASFIFGYSAEEAIGKNASMLMSETNKDLRDGLMPHDLHKDESRVLGTQRLFEGRRKGGDLFPASLSMSKIAQHGKIIYIGLVRDITQQRQDEEEIYRLAFYDPLTQLPNRRLLFDRLKQAMATATRTHQYGALMFLDLDHFKQLNDSLGHDFGDALLRQVSTRLQTCVRACDSIARMGGDEFVLLIEDLNPLLNEAASQTEVITQKVLAALGLPYQLGEHTYVITPSIGIVMFSNQTDNIEELLKRADLAMYQAKSAGRNNARFFDPAMQAAASVRVELERNLRIALEQSEFSLHYQLQVNSMGAPTGAEALVRWNHPKHGTIPPSIFIALAEETGMILPLGQWVLETACQQLVEWQAIPERVHWTLAVNVSALQFSRPDFVSSIENALVKTHANPRLLKLEITESMLAKDIDDVIIKMFEIKALGVTFSLDDFGTGYSSLSYLKRLPLDQLKIDQSFVRDLLTDPNDAVIARTIVTLGHSLGLNVIAEGVETVEQRASLFEMGCDAYQGYYFAQPVAAESLEESLNNIPPQ